MSLHATASRRGGRRRVFCASAATAATFFVPGGAGRQALSQHGRQGGSTGSGWPECSGNFPTPSLPCLTPPKNSLSVMCPGLRAKTEVGPNARYETG